MFKKFALLLLGTFFTAGCEREATNAIDDLNSIKKKFLLSIVDSGVEESPFQMDYALRTVFFSPDVISLFGKIHVYDHLPHGWWRYEGKTLCRIRGRLQEIRLWDLFSEVNQREFIREYCENALKADPVSYFVGSRPLRTRLEYEDIRSFVIDDKFLIIFFQPYTVGGLSDDPLQVKIPYEHLEKNWNKAHPFPRLLQEMLSSQSYTISLL